MDNPADLASRGCTSAGLMQNKLWWQGPTWLSQGREVWPTVEFLETASNKAIATKEYSEMTNRSVSLAAPEGAKAGVGMVIDRTRYSSLTTLLRVTAWCSRIAHKVNKVDTQDRKVAPLTPAELQTAKTKWVKYVQEIHYSDIIDALDHQKSHPIIRELGLWRDENGIIRCGGRLTNANESEMAVFPILLPKKDHFTSLIIQATHEKLFHAGVSHTLAEIRKEFWIPAGRSIVFNQIQKCVRCRKFDAGPYKLPNMAPLPKSRVTPSFPFEHTGLDYMGTLHVKERDGTRKVWICLFTCFCTRAVHLEVVNDMSAEEFLLCLKRFVGRRGQPTTITSDNAGQFKLICSLTNKAFKRVFLDKNVVSYASERNFEWHFIAERAPWQGGVYERLVRLVKQSLRKTLGNLCLSMTQLQTLVVEIEAVVNSRPLMYIGADFDGMQVLTPGNFLSVNPKTSGPILGEARNMTHDQISSRKRLIEMWKRGQKHLEQFWKVWKTQYLLSLREKWQKDVKQPRCRSKMAPHVGDIVLVHDNGPRGSWKLARISRLYTSQDGKVRTAEIRLKTGVVTRRSIMHLYPMECMPEEILHSSVDKNLEDEDSE